MAVLLENIHFAPGESLRLLRWRGNAQSLQSLEAGGRRTAASGVGGRWHSHAEMEFTIFQRGSGLRYVGDHVGAFGEMDCVLLGSHLPHCWMEQGRTDGYVLQFRLPAEHPLRRLGGARELQRLFAAAERGIHFRPAVARAALVLLERMAAASKLGRAGLLLELLALLHDALKKQAATLSQTRVFAEADAATSPRLESVVQWVLEQFIEPLTLAEAVKRSAMSRATFCRQFARHTGKTFIAFVTDARLAYAHQLLTQTQRGIADIAYASGFGSLTRFNAAFREKFGKAPRGVR
ncbi:MAG: AraC family transcriptional regulator [Limisphaerales bacterium]